MASELPRATPLDRAHDAVPDASAAGAPDALTRLLEELARAPDDALADAWGRTLAPGEVVGRFELLREAGRGGFGVVYEARDRDLGRLVAFKALRPGRGVGALRVEAMRREAEAAARLNHPNVVTIHDFGTCPAGPYLILELLRGEPLSQPIDAGPLPPREAVRIATGVARALAHAHAAGVVHRDLKPGNVFLCADGNVKVLDFGLAQLLGAGASRGGTPGYMAPEQYRGEAEDARTDLFGLGVLLFRMLTGELPYPVVHGRSAALDPGPAPAPPGKAIPPRLGALVQRLLAKEPDARPASSAEVERELGSIGRALDPVRARRRHQRMATLAAAGLAVAAAMGTFAWRSLHGDGGERLTVAVADFANETGDRDLEGLSAMLITSLEGSRRLSVLTRSRIRDELRSLGRDAAGPLDETVGREIGQRLGAKALLLASVRRFDQTYAVELRALDPASNRYLFAASAKGEGKGSIPDLIDRLSERTRRELRDPGRGSEPRLPAAKAVTANLDAYQHFFRGMECIDRPSRRGGPLALERCTEHFVRATEADPGFALAHYQLAYLQDFLHRGDPHAAIDAAMRHLDRAPPKERGLILAWKAHLDGKDDEALRRYREVIERYPEDKQALFLAGDLLYHAGDLLGAAPYLEAVLALDPAYENALHHAVRTLGILRRTDDLAGYVKRWSTLPSSPALAAAAARAHFWLGDPGAAVAVARRAVDEFGGTARVLDLAAALFSSGDYGGAEAALRAGLRADGDSVQLRLYLTYALEAQGREREARAALDALEGPLAELPGEYHFLRAVQRCGEGDAAATWAAAEQATRVDPRRAAELAVHVALVGDASHAAQLASELTPRSPEHEAYLAVADWKAGNGSAAKTRLRALDATEPVPNTFTPSYLLAEVAASQGDDGDVVEAVSRMRSLWALGPHQAWAHPRSLLLLARAQARLGERRAARETLERLLAGVARADPGLPLVREARALRAELSAD